MTRLREEDIYDVGANLSYYDRQLIHKVGTNLAGIAAHALGKTPGDFVAIHDTALIGVIPVTCGQGIIGGFSTTVQKIIEFLGFTAFVTATNDVSGLAEAVKKGARIIFLADDNDFVAINLVNGQVSDNGEATGRGYAAALDLMSGGVQGKNVLVIGAGPVGAGAAAFMTAQGARVLVHDIDTEKVEKMRQVLPGIEVAKELHAALTECKLVVEATPAAATIDKKYIDQDILISAPGIPLGIDQESCVLVSERLIHDVLEIGVATMLFTVLSE
ncbi:hypothetical protein SCACP_01980 [Sporomusa carbonis]|uniref:3-methylornithyl-N6-L-lysine dehydrogenase PylD n=1 Tax=Sporomusa carbonis TaxID=3076075 RepID=UPI003A6F4157